MRRRRHPASGADDIWSRSGFQVAGPGGEARPGKPLPSRLPGRQFWSLRYRLRMVDAGSGSSEWVPGSPDTGRMSWPCLHCVRNGQGGPHLASPMHQIAMATVATAPLVPSQPRAPHHSDGLDLLGAGPHPEAAGCGGRDASRRHDGRRCHVARAIRRPSRGVASRSTLRGPMRRRSLTIRRPCRF
jgi:hypothetical protein